MKNYILLAIVIILAGGVLIYKNSNQFDLPRGETTILETENKEVVGNNFTVKDSFSDTVDNSDKNKITMTTFKSKRQILVTDNVKHSVPLDEILAGGPPKDGIPPIDNPKFVSVGEANSFLSDDSVGLGLSLNGEVRFYPYQILVYHEIVNDDFDGVPALITYCPLCATGVVFDPLVNEEKTSFGTSGKLWQSNLLMYNRASDESKESLWSQVLGEAVLGEFTGTRLEIIPSSTVKYGEWKGAHKDTVVLSRDTGASRSYGQDPYGSYYTDDSVSFGARFNDDRLHPKAFVLGIELDGRYKAYHKEALKIGMTDDVFAGTKISIEKDKIGVVKMFAGEDRASIQFIGGFWFSWLAVHSDTELYK